MKELGGYIELEFNRGYEYHSNALRLNTARNCFEYVLRARKIKKIYLPHYTCDVMLEPINKLEIEFIYYHVDENLEPILNFRDTEGDYILYTNYFGIKQHAIKKLSDVYKNLIVDNCQGFYHMPVGDLDTFYSARKFFGVPDGGYLYTKSNPNLKLNIEQDYSYERSAHLLKRIETGANEGYQLFLENDYKLYNQPIRKMSLLSRSILAGADYENSKTIRERNFLYLHSFLYGRNELKIDLTDFSGPMFYPLLIENKEIRKYLVENRIYIPFLWKNVFDTTRESDFEQYLANYCLPLPIDQRYNLEDMCNILNILKKFM